jgi:hypothetical protein
MYSSDKDYTYLLLALSAGGCSVTNPEVRASFIKLGYMAPAKLRIKYSNGMVDPFGMALTKKGQKRAMQIKAQLARDRKEYLKNRYRRGVAGAAYPKSYKISTLHKYVFKPFVDDYRNTPSE